jgi:NAD(P)-dependent dehydrogenase (short-subunit alcohol dehydrogenase family)
MYKRKNIRQAFKNKVVLITGGASGIGLATAWEFARAGAKIAMLDMDTAMLKTRLKEFETQRFSILTLVCDVTDENACLAAVKICLDKFKAMDLLFNNAGITQRSLFENTKASVIKQVMAVNFFGSLYITQAALPSLIAQKGTIIINESVAGVSPLLGRCGYAASKHALHGFFTSLRCELRHKGVHVIIVCPGFIKTNLQARALGGNGKITNREQTRIGGQQTPEFVAEQILIGVQKNQSMMVFTFLGKLGYLISRLWPSLYERLMTQQFKSELEENN